MSSTSTPLPRPTKSIAKPALWSLFALAGLSILFLYDLPMFNPANSAHGRMVANRLFLVPHILSAVTAIFLGPIQFSTRFRQRYLGLHRIFGKVYVGCVLVAAPCAVGLARHAPGILLFAAIVQAFLWVALTLAAFITARNRHITQHRQWMIRSYGVGCTIFVLTRVTDPIPAFHKFTPAELSVSILFYIILALVIPSFTSGWSEITTQRAPPAR
jgi:uncharacterized membrane protein